MSSEGAIWLAWDDDSGDDVSKYVHVARDHSLHAFLEPSKGGGFPTRLLFHATSPGPRRILAGCTTLKCDDGVGCARVCFTVTANIV